MREDFVGRGWAWPVRVGSDGRVVLVGGEGEIDQSIELIVRTAPGERPMRPEFGCEVHAHLFAPADGATAGLLRDAVARAIDRWEPRVDLRDVRVAPGDADGELVVEVDYVVRATNSPRNLVFPYYTIREEREPDTALPTGGGSA